jgi:hypothetical protein
MATKCTATTKQGRACQAWAVPDTDPPLCAAHGGAQSPPGAPTGNRNAEKHGFYTRPSPLTTIDDAIQHLAASLARLDKYINAHIHDLDTADIARLTSVYGMNLSRFVRMLKDKAATDPSDDLHAAINEALSLAQEQLGVEL